MRRCERSIVTTIRPIRAELVTDVADFVARVKPNVGPDGMRWVQPSLTFGAHELTRISRLVSGFGATLTSDVETALASSQGSDSQ